jgi:hypothetical protein
MTKRQESQRSLRVEHATASQTKTWIERELVGSEFTDVRLNKRFRKLFQSSSPRAPARAFFGLPGLGKHQGGLSFSVQPPRERRGRSCWTLPIHTRAIRGHGFHCFIIVLHDTTEFNYHRENIRSVGILHRLPVRRRLNGQLQHYVVCGIAFQTGGDHR